jgi:hypothetical protein
MVNRPYVILRDDEMMAIALSLSPSLDLNEVHNKLIAVADEIKALPIDHPRRQLLAALRLRQRCISDPFYQRKEQFAGLQTWFNLQASQPLNA